MIDTFELYILILVVVTFKVTRIRESENFCVNYTHTVFSRFFYNVNIYFAHSLFKREYPTYVILLKT